MRRASVAERRLKDEVERILKLKERKGMSKQTRRAHAHLLTVVACLFGELQERRISKKGEFCPDFAPTILLSSLPQRCSSAQLDPIP
jgi:hypothetical protein